MGFERSHPAVNLLYFTAVIAWTIMFRHPVFLAISVVCSFAYSVKRNGVRALVFNLCLMIFVAAFVLYYASYNHFGITVLWKNSIGNNVTVEAIVCGAATGLAIAGCIMWMSCVHAVFSSDKAVYLFGRVSPRLSLFLAILLRMVPRIKKEARRINTAQNGIGRGGGQGNILQRIKNCIRVFSMMITWTIESLSTASESMRSRGNSLRGRTAFSIYRFDNRDRAYVVCLFFCFTIVMMGAMLNQAYVAYDPRIIMNPITPVTYLFYAGHAAFCLMPLGMELWTEHRFRQAQRSL